MAYNPILSAAISIGSAIKKELWDLVQGNFSDHESRINSIEASIPKIPVIKFYVLNGSSFSTATGLYYYEANDNFTITSAYVQIFEKGSLSGTFQVDIKKSTTDLDGPSFSSIFTTKPSVNFTTASDYAKSTNQVLDPTKISISNGNYLRFDITQTPSGGVMSKFPNHGLRGVTMSAPFIIPFNFQPNSTTAKTSSYTIPAGFYAEIFDDAGNMSINGTSVGTLLTVGSGATATSATFNHPPTSLIRFDWSINGSGVDTFTLTNYGTFGRSDGVTSSGSFIYFTQYITSSTVSSLSSNDTCTFTASTWLKNSTKIWVKSGEIIAGNKYWVTLFPMIS